MRGRSRSRIGFISEVKAKKRPRQTVNLFREELVFARRQSYFVSNDIIDARDARRSGMVQIGHLHRCAARSHGGKSVPWTEPGTLHQHIDTICTNLLDELAVVH